MTVSAQTTFNQTTGNGVTTVFPYQFKILASGDLQVYVAGVLKTLGVDYTVSGVGNNTGGNVTFLLGAPAALAVVSIIRAMQVVRSTDYQQQGDFNADTVNPDFDRAILLIQDAQTQLGRTIRTPADEVGTLPTLPSISVRANTFLAFDSNGRPIQSSGTGADAGLRSDLASLVPGLGRNLVSVPKTTEESAAGLTVLNPYYNPYTALRYCAVDAGTNTTDSTAALQALINAVSYGETIFVPALPNGSYLRITDELTIPAGKSVNFLGESPTNSRIHQTTAGKGVFKSLATFASPANNSSWKDLCITATSGTYGIYLRGNSRSTVRRCFFSGFINTTTSAGIRIEDCLILSIEDNRFTSNYNGIYSIGSVNTGWNGGGVIDNMFEAQLGYAIWADYVNGVTFAGNTIESNQLGGIFIFNGGGGLQIAGNYFEQNKKTGTAGAVAFFDIYIGQSSYLNGGSISGNYFNGNNGIARGTDDYVPIRFKFARGWKVEGNQLNTGTNFVAFDASSDLKNCSFGRIGFHSESGASFDKGTGLTATYYNVSAFFPYLTSGNDIEGLTKVNDVVQQRYVRMIEAWTVLSQWSQAVTGTGACFADGKGLYVDTGATNTSTARASINGLCLSTTLGQSNVNWQDKEIIFEAVVSNIAAGTSTGKAWLMLTTAAAVADPATRTIGFRIDQDAIKGICHDGTTLNVVDLTTSLAAGISTVLRCEKAAGIVSWYVNGILKGTTTTNVPNTSSTAVVFNLSAANGANNAQQRLGVYDLKISVSQ